MMRISHVGWVSLLRMKLERTYYLILIGKYGTHLFGIESFANCWDELKPLYDQHWKETDQYSGKDEPDVDMEYMEALESTGRMLLFTCRDKDMKLVGYLVYSLSNNLHLKGEKIAEEAGFFFLKEKRGTGAAPSFLFSVEMFLKDLGVTQIHAVNKALAGGTDIDRLLRRRGYEPVAVYYCKTLED